LLSDMHVGYLLPYDIPNETKNMLQAKKILA
jgi:hypothetical protein